jgi:heavy metal translocating P-type ATPase
MIKKFWNLFKDNKQLVLVVLAILIALPLDLVGKDTVSHWLLGLAAIASVIPLTWDMIQDLRSGKYGVDILAATAIVTSVIMQEYWAAIVIVLMLTGGESLEAYAQARARTELDALLSSAPKKAHVLRGRKTVDIAVSEVHAGDKLIIKAGEIVPVDAVILEGSASFDESSLTGESLPVIKKEGEELLSGSISLDGAVTVRALRLAEDSQFEQIIKMVKAAASSKSPIVRLADRYAIPFTIISFAIAIGAWVISGESIRFLEVLVVATPCPLIFGAPIALISGMSRAAKQGIIIKTGTAMERLADIKTIGFDKTGTLTKGQPEVHNIFVYGNNKKADVLGLAAALEQKSGHVLAKAIVNEALKQKVKVVKAKNVQEWAGNGLSAHVHGLDVVVGRLGLIKEQNIKTPKGFKSASIQQTASFVAIDGELAGIITFKDEIRPEAKETLLALTKLGIKHRLMVTGDNQATANSIAKQLGIEDVRAETLPVDKLRAIEGIQARPVAFVGDGVNDAPVLAAADVGIALGARGSAAASESADVVIMLDDLARVATGVAIAKRTFFIAKQSILIGIAISVGLMFIFSTGKFKPVYGAAIQEVVDVIVIFNALRAHLTPKTEAN